MNFKHNISALTKAIRGNFRVTFERSNIMTNPQVKFADLGEANLAKLRQAESSLNASLGNASEEIILLAYSKVNK